MKSNEQTARRPMRDLKRLLNLYGRDESGQMTFFAVYLILIMLILGGTGVDLMRNEMERTRMQAVADRAVLAAADLDQTLDPESVVRDYFAKAGMADFVSSVRVTPGLNSRTVEVNAATETNTQFMKNLGVPTLRVPAKAVAMEKISKVEVSLVLDISGSMNDGNKMDNMQDAAGAFVDAVLKPENDGLISVSLVPYSEHVNAGPNIYQHLRTYDYHNYSHCVEFDNADFNSTVLNLSKWYTQMQHFQWNTYSIESGYLQNTRYDTVCPRYSYERILPFQKDPQIVKDQIDLLKPRAGTQIFLGMKWAAALLDSSFQPVTQQLALANTVPAVFDNRPAPFTDEETLKTIVLMTDGQNSRGNRIATRYYNSSSEVVHWARYNFNWYLSNYVSYWRHGEFYWNKYSESAADTLLQNMCQAAKDEKIVIWTVGFEVGDHGADQMRQCASSPSHFFRVEGVEIKDAFEAVARSINQLRLTQ